MKSQFVANGPMDGVILIPFQNVENCLMWGKREGNDVTPQKDKNSTLPSIENNLVANSTIQTGF